MCKYSVIIPCYNENSRGILIPNVNNVKSYCDYFIKDYEILVIDDGSTDNSYDILLSAYKYYNNIKIYKLDENKGKGYSLRYGISKVSGEYIIYMDADLSTPLYYLRSILELIDENTCVIATRYAKESDITSKTSLIRKFISFCARHLINFETGLCLTDTQCGFKMFHKNKEFDISKLEVDTWLFDVELLLYLKSLNYEIKELPIIWNNMEDSRVKPISATINSMKELNFISNKYKKGANKNV